MWENSPADTKVIQKEGEEVLQVQEQRFSCSLWRNSWWRRLFPCSPRSAPVEQTSTCGGPCAAGGRDARRKLQSMESPHWSRVLPEAVTHGEEPKQQQVFWQEPFACTSSYGNIPLSPSPSASPNIQASQNIFKICVSSGCGGIHLESLLIDLTCSSN